MSIIQKDLKVVQSPAETLPEFLRTTSDPRVGLEVESHFVDRNLKAATIAAYNQLARDVNGRAKISLEAASTMFEVKNDIPKTPSEGAGAAADELIGELSVIESQIYANDHIMLPHSILPWSDYAQLAKTHIHTGPNPRPTSFINYFMANDPKRARNFITVAGQQSSLTHKTTTDTLRYYNRLAHLTPLLATVMSTVPPYALLDDGRIGAITSNVSLERRLQTAGHVTKAFPLLDQVNKIDDANAQRFMEGWNDYVWDTPIFSYYDPDDTDEFTRLKHFDGGAMISFRDLPKRLQTRENFNMASSIQYGLITMSHLPAGENTPDRRRVEARLFDTGTANQIRTVAGLTFALAFDEEFGDRSDDFVKRHGYDIHCPAKTLPLLHDTLSKVAHTSFDSLDDLPYGTSSIAQAAARFYTSVINPLLSQHPELEGLASQCLRGGTPALEFRKAVSDNAAFENRMKLRQAVYTNPDETPPVLAVF